jgi:hypothetical protein
MSTLNAPCLRCNKHTVHEVLHKTESLDVHKGRFRYETIQCRGCMAVSLKETRLKGRQVTYHPSPRNIPSRSLPDWWDLFEWDSSMESLIREVYEADNNDLPRLAMIGIRAILERVMIGKVGDHGNISRNLDEFQKAGYASTMQFDSLQRVLDAGSAVMHRNHVPEPESTMVAFWVLENILYAAYVQTKHLEQINVPERPRRKPNNSGGITQ